MSTFCCHPRALIKRSRRVCIGCTPCVAWKACMAQPEERRSVNGLPALYWSHMCKQEHYRSQRCWSAEYRGVFWLGLVDSDIHTCQNDGTVACQSQHQSQLAGEIIKNFPYHSLLLLIRHANDFFYFFSSCSYRITTPDHVHAHAARQSSTASNHGITACISSS